MDRDEILNRNKASKPTDEGTEYIESNSKIYGEKGLCAFFILLVIYKMIKGLPTDDILGIFWGYLGVSYIYKYNKYKTKKALFTAICGMIAAVCFTLSYVLKTW